MPLVVKDRVRETSTTTGTGTFTLAGAVTGYQSFSAVGNGNTTYYTIYLQGGNEWEVGIGTYTSSGTTLSRDTILASSNGGSAVNFSAGVKDVFVTYPAGRSVWYDSATNVTLNQLSATTVDTTNLEVTNIKAKDGTASITLADSTGIATFSKATVIETTDNTNAALRVTQLGTGLALLVEDSANPDSTPFVVTAGGDVGIGTNGPAQKLHINVASGNVYQQISSGSNNVYVGIAAGPTGAVESNNALVFNVGNTYAERARIDSSGTLILRQSSNAANTSVSFNTTVQDALTLDSSGRLGVGLTSLAATITANESGGGAIRALRSTVSSEYIQMDHDGTNGTLRVSGANAMIFNTNGSERTRITSVGGLIVTPAATGHAVFNEDGVDADFRVEGDTDTHLIFADASTDRVGIGTNAPGEKLNVLGGGATTSTVNFTGGATGNDNATIASDYGLVFQVDANNNVGNREFIWRYGGKGYSDGTFLMSLNSSGNLGLGVTPSAWGGSYKAFQFNSTGAIASNGINATAVGNNYFFDGTNNKYLVSALAANAYLMSSGEHRWYIDVNAASPGAAGTNITFNQAMTLDASGNLGIGVTSVNPTGLAILSGGQGKGVLVARNTSGSPTSGQSLGSYAFKGVADGVNSNAAAEAMIEAVAAENQTGFSAATNMLFYTKPSGTGPGSAPTERARITSGGYFKASNNGTYDNSTGSYHELDSDQDNSAVYIKATNASLSTTGVLQLGISRNTTNNSFYAISYYNSGATAYKFRVADSGDVTNTNNSYTGISDVKLKQDIVDAASQWDDIKNLQVRKYRLKSDPDKVQIGLVAQEAELVSPGLVDEHPDYEEVEVTDEDGNITKERQPTGTVTKSVKYSVLYMKAVKALQEAMTRIEQLEAKVASLESKGA